jgi:hypothetical protein
LLSVTKAPTVSPSPRRSLNLSGTGMALGGGSGDAWRRPENQKTGAPPTAARQRPSGATQTAESRRVEECL